MWALAQRAVQQGQQAGLAAVGIAPATPMDSTRRVLEERKRAGLSGGMQFTYRNPARSTDPSRALPGAAALVVGAWPYGPEGRGHAGEGRLAARCRPAGGPRGPAGGRAGAGQGPKGAEGCGGATQLPLRPRGRVARYAWEDHYTGLRAALGQVAGVLEAAGWRARVLVDDNALVDRAAAHRAGLGWFGKNSNILLPGRGSWFVLGSVATDAPLPTGTPVAGTCGPCQHCLQACPTGALVAPGTLDARKCLAWLLQCPGVFPWEHREALGDRIYGCDDCQDVCPVNRLAARRASTAGAGGPGASRPGPGRATNGGTAGAGELALGGEEPPDGSGARAGGRREVDVLDLLAASDQELLQGYGRWYIPRRDPRYLRRNALVVLGNTADGSSPAVESAVRAYLAHDDELLRAHAIWAAARLGRADLVTSARPPLAWGPAPLVQEELARLGQVRPARAGVQGRAGGQGR